MLKQLSKRKLQAAALILSVVAVAYARITGPEPGYTNAPGDIGNCTACHDHPGQTNVGPGSVSIGGVPAVYQQGQTYDLTVSVRQAGRQRFGFQLTAIDLSGNKAGALSAVGSDTKVIPETGFGGRQYIEHTQTGTFTSTPGSRTWQVRWTAPSDDLGTIRFYVAGNAADGDGTNQGNDYIYLDNTTSDSATSAVAVSLESKLDGTTLVAGSKYTISWKPTNASNVTGYELRYSTDDGATFPISNLIITITDSSVTSYEWTVPDTPAAQARLRVEASLKSGAAINVKSGRFAITGSGGGPVLQVPKISGASVSGKKLIVTGADFDTGATLFMNDEKVKKVSNDEDDPKKKLVAKKAGKQIERGQTVSLVVENNDGTRSEVFLFTRPND